MPWDSTVGTTPANERGADMRCLILTAVLSMGLAVGLASASRGRGRRAKGTQDRRDRLRPLSRHRRFQPEGRHRLDPLVPGPQDHRRLARPVPDLLRPAAAHRLHSHRRRRAAQDTRGLRGQAEAHPRRRRGHIRLRRNHRKEIAPETQSRRTLRGLVVVHRLEIVPRPTPCTPAP